MREVFPVKYYKDEGFVERKIELDDEDLDQIIEEYLRRHAEFDFDEIKNMMNSIRPDALASLLGEGEAQNGSRPGREQRQLRDLTCGESSEPRNRSAWGGWR